MEAKHYWISKTRGDHITSLDHQIKSMDLQPDLWIINSGAIVVLGGRCARNEISRAVHRGGGISLSEMLTECGGMSGIYTRYYMNDYINDMM